MSPVLKYYSTRSPSRADSPLVIPAVGCSHQYVEDGDGVAIDESLQLNFIMVLF